MDRALLNEWQRKDQRRRQDLEKKVRSRAPDEPSPPGCPLWLDQETDRASVKPASSSGGALPTGCATRE
jgi:hypothetical protein